MRQLFGGRPQVRRCAKMRRGDSTKNRFSRPWSGKQRCRERQSLGWMQHLIAWRPERTTRVHWIQNHVSPLWAVKLRQVLHGQVIDDRRLTAFPDLHQQSPDGSALARSRVTHHQEAAFAANDAKIACCITEAARAYRKPAVDDPSVVEYEGISGFPSFCQLAHRRQRGRVQFALIHMANVGTSPANMFASLATYIRQQFYPDVDAGRIDWYDVMPAGVYHTRRTEILQVTMEHATASTLGLPGT
jgi:hypothetical protein